VSPGKLWAIAVKELRQAARDPLSLAMLLGLPTMMLLFYGYALNFDVRHVSLAVQDEDKTAASRELVASFVNSTYFDLARDLAPGTDLGELTERRLARAVLVIPEGYARELAADRTARVQLILDGTDANTAMTVLGYASALVAEANVEIVRGAAGGAGAGPPIDYRPRAWYNPELRSTQFLVPGLIGYILMQTCVLATALSVVREKERGTMEQLLVTSLRPAELIVGKTIPYLGIMALATVMIVVAARVLFDIRVRGSYLDLSAVVLVYLVGALAFGLVISSFSDTQAMAFQAGIVTSTFPAIFLSGFIFPIRSMPPVVQAITYAIPARYFITIVRGVILKGADLGPHLRDMAFLALYAATMLGIAFARLRRRDL
jgi:ABC-2 type transport system permease protein